jgi:hypothetical protein
MLIEFRGKKSPFIPQDKLTPGEIDAVERVTDLTFQKIRRLGDVCVCDHNVSAHRHKDDAAEFTDDLSCTICDCEGHQANLPTRVSTALMWVSIKRADPSVKYSDVSDCPLDEINLEDEGSADPTEPPPAAE